MSGIVDPLGLLLDPSPWHDAVVEVGCGPRKRYSDSIGIDAIAFPGVELVGDAVEVLQRIPAESVKLVTSSHFLEHVPDLEGTLLAMKRIVRIGGTIEVIVPHFSHPWFYSDPTHKTPFGLYTFSYLGSDAIFSRRVPRYAEVPGLRLERADLIFKSNRPFYVRYGIKRVLGLIVNSSPYLQELYEENFCFMFPCYEIRFQLERTE